MTPVDFLVVQEDEERFQEIRLVRYQDTVSESGCV